MKTKIVGLTGGIGSGKSTIAAYFKSLGVPVYIADDEAKKILFTPEAIVEVVEAFGPDVLTDGNIKVTFLYSGCHKSRIGRALPNLFTCL